MIEVHKKESNLIKEELETYLYCETKDLLR